MNERCLIFDSSSLISLAMNGLLDELKKLKEIFPGKFLIPEEVKREVVERPLKIKKFELEALKLKQLIDQKVLEFPDSVGVQSQELLKKTEEFLNFANGAFFSNVDREIHLIDAGEATCLALNKILDDKGFRTAVAVDERTTRLLSERPENLKKILEKKMHTKIKVKSEDLKIFEGTKIVRSAELMHLAYKKGLIELKDKIILDAVLYALKDKGCAISTEEIETLKKI